MKKFYLLIILLVSGLGFAQVNLSGNATYALKISGKVGADGSSCGDNVTRGLQWVASRDKNNVFKTIIQGSASYPNNGHGLTAQSFDPAIVYFKENERIQELKLRATKRDRGNTGCKGVQYSNASIAITTYPYSGFFNFADLALNQSGNIQINIYPIINLVNPNTVNNIIGTESSIKIPAIDGVQNEFFEWMFHIDGEQTRVRVGNRWVYQDTWRSLPAIYQGKNSLDILCKDFLPFEAVGKRITLRANVNGTTVDLFYAKSAPQIASLDPLQTRCFDTKDGRVIIKFSSKLVTGETLTCSILSYDPVTGEEQETFYSTPDGQSIIIGNDLTYEIPYDFPKGKYRIKLLGWYKEQNKPGANTYVMDPKHQKEFEITSPKPVDFSTTKRDINCFGGSDGAIDVVATGGIDNGIYQYSKDHGATWITFLYGDKTTISNLPLGFCYVRVRKLRDSNDTVGCIAKIPEGDPKEDPKEIGQPTQPLAQSGDIITTQSTFFGAENGSIIVSIKGGSLIDGNSYSYKWRNEKNELIDNAKSSTVFFDGIFTITLKNVPQGTYTLSVEDNFKCALQPEPFGILIDPKPIKINLKVKQNISCNSANLGEEGIPTKASASNGILVALVEGGKILDAKANKGLPYYFNWKMLNSNGEWEELKEKKDSVASGLSAGTYSINVEDANGISHGTYTLKEQTPIALEKSIAEPDAMKVLFSSGNVSCFEGDNGHAKASIENGKSTYSYTWYGPGRSGVVAEELSNLVKGTYHVEVVDLVKGCSVKDSIEIKGPNAKLAIKYLERISPTYAGASNGKIIAEIIGGTDDNGTYNFAWKNKAGTVQFATGVVDTDKYIITLEGIPADTYFLTVTDKNYDLSGQQIVNCSIIDHKVELTEPKPLKVTFEKKGISCNAENQFGNPKDTNPDDGQRDESQDGILIAHVTGGVNLKSSDNNNFPYYYTWKKEQLDGTWKNLAIQDSIAPNLSHGNYAFNVEDANGIVLGVYANNQLVEKIDVIQFMQQPPKLSVSITSGDVFCHGGNDGWATATATGGTPPYEYRWSNGVEIDKNTVLKTGTYTVFVTDFNTCTTQASVEILEPKTPIAIKYTEVLDPSFYKATNGKIVVEVTGGTISKNNSYWFEWKNSKGIVQTTTTANFSNGVYTISLNGVGEENYSLTVRDANYDAATNKTSCTVANSVTALDDPDPLEVAFEVVRTISCNVSNEFGNETDANPQDNQRDESQDGILVAHVTGGIQLKADQNNGLPYFYTWKKQQGNSWIIWNDHDQTAENISDGTYALNIEDANGIKLGTYVNNLLVQEKDVIHYMPEPAKLQLSFTKFDVGCTTGDDGWAEVHVSGGTPPYTYEWTNGETTPKIENITTNNYFVIATDAKGCVVQGSIFVGDPNGIFTTETVKNPTCYKGNDASIALNVTGGNLPYSYLWNNGSTSKDLNNLTAGNYEVAITCPDCCVYKKRFVLKDPEPIIVNVGPDRTLCIDQNLDLDATITDQKALYSWTSTNGFTSDKAKVNVSKAGTYHVKVTSGLGCIGEDEVIIKTSQIAISSEFLVSSQAYLDEEVILVNTSNPFGESTNWVIPKGVKVVEQKEKYITLKFDATGVYAIGLQQTQGECYAVYSKNIAVEQRDALPNVGTTSQFIVDFIVTPNPSNGNFKALVTLENTSAINLRLFSTTGQNTMIQKKEAGKKKYEIDFDTSLESGMYVLVLETGQQTLVKKIIIY